MLQILFSVFSAVCLVLPSLPLPLYLRKDAWIFWWWKYLETTTLVYSKVSDNRRQIEETQVYLFGGFNSMHVKQIH